MLAALTTFCRANWSLSLWHLDLPAHAFSSLIGLVVWFGSCLECGFLKQCHYLFSWLVSTQLFRTVFLVCCRMISKWRVSVCIIRRRCAKSWWKTRFLRASPNGSCRLITKSILMVSNVVASGDFFLPSKRRATFGHGQTCLRARLLPWISTSFCYQWSKFVLHWASLWLGFLPTAIQVRSISIWIII